ncbi:MAG TPA: molybdopterin-synthase adenylyltransferase MoeB [Fibrobacteria bacterium]|nr:molybdopterin-synthase adenylyltransferase MoeB [Fibrobacteria bacterium]
MAIFSEDQMRRYMRHLILNEVGFKGQMKLAAAKVLCIGAGGLGSPALYYLAAAGVGTIGIAEGDVVDDSNLQRQIIHFTEDVGRPKLQSAREKIARINPGVSVQEHPGYLDASNAVEIVSRYDFVIDGSDNFPTKFLVNDACVIAGKPFSHAGILRFEGQAMTIVPRKSRCYRCLFREPPPAGSVPNCAEAGILGVVAGTLGTIQATEALKCILGKGDLLTDRLLIYDALSMRFRESRGERDPECAVCGEHPTILKPIDYGMPACSDPM